LPRVPADHRASAEAWFVEHGLPWFVDDVRAEVQERMRRGRVVAVLLTGVLLGAVAGVVAGLAVTGWVGFALALTVVGAVLLAYALWALRARVIAGWALRRAFSSLRLMLPLATRALPMLLLFITFLFINTEVWQVASELRGGVLWSAILFFIAAALGFLVPRLAQELEAVDDDLSVEQLCETARRTPVGPALDEVGEHVVDLEEVRITGLQKVNLVTVLAIAQAVQVLLLSVAVFVFFIVFGAVAITPHVIHEWIGQAPSYPPGPHLVSLELIRVATFLAGFTGLYFTVTAITDELYRREFFATILSELERAVAVRSVYRGLVRASGTPAPPARDG
jgi:MFS family permease